jgi:DNA-binding LacI/PurR family transcriptional regulator
MTRKPKSSIEESAELAVTANSGGAQRPSRLQMADIARLAGVSTSTVSRALAKSSVVNAETRKRIEDLAKQLNYSINVGAQNLRLRENRTVAVVLPYNTASKQTVSDPFFLSMIGSLANALTDRGYDMLLSRVDEDQLEGVGQLYDTGRAMGLVVIGQWHHHDQLNALAARHVPFVVWGAQLPQQLYCSVGSDNLSGGAAATDHLIALGRKRIAFLGDINLPEVGQRYAGYLSAHAKRKVKPMPELVVPVPFLAEGARAAIAALCDDGLKFDAIFASSDVLAMTAISTLLQRGKRVPEDVAVVGYDDVELSQHFHPPLSTVRQPIDEAGQVMVDALQRLIKGERVPPCQLQTSLIVRGSTTAG